jgi:hypothetical protein
VAGFSSISLGLVLQYDFDGAVEVARVAKSRAIDPFYRAWATFYETLGLAWAGRVDESRTAVRELQAYGGRFWTTLARPLEGLTLLGEGRLSAGMGLLRQHLDYVTRIRSKWLENFARIMLGRLFTDIVCREFRLPALTLLRNPGFVFRSVIGAGDRARRYLEGVIRETEGQEVIASLGVAHLNLARLDYHDGDLVGARLHLEKAIKIFDGHGAAKAIAGAAALAGALGIDIPTIKRRL